MNKISIYTLLILIYLGLSKSFSLSEKGTTYIKNQQMLASLFLGAPTTVILVDYFDAGLLIKTYFHRYKVIHGFKKTEFITSRVSGQFFQDNLANLGMSIFSRSDRDGKESSVPMPPGSLFVADHAYGSWVIQEQEKVWQFHRAYKTFPQKFGWGDFVPSMEFYKRLNAYEVENRPYYGLNNEFGTEGSVTKAANLKPSADDTELSVNWKRFFGRYKFRHAKKQ